MNAWVIFHKARFILFAFLILGCLTWVTLVAIFLSHEWSYFTHFQKMVVVSLLSLYGFTAILLYLMVVVHFCFWWDVTRVVSLLFVHAGGSVLFMHYSPNFSCRGFDLACRKFVYTISIGSWVLFGIILGFFIALGIMAFVSRPVETLPGCEDDDEVPPSSASFETGNPTGEQQCTSFYMSILINGVHQETILVGPPRLWQDFRNSDRRRSHDNSAYDGSISTGITSPPTSIHSQASMIDTSLSVRGETSSMSQDRPNPSQSSAFPEPIHGASSPVALRGSPMVTQCDRATEYTPALYSIQPLLTSEVPRGGFVAGTDTPRPCANSDAQHIFIPLKRPPQIGSSPHALPPLVLMPGIARFRGPSALSRPGRPFINVHRSVQDLGIKTLSYTQYLRTHQNRATYLRGCDASVV